MKRFIDRSIKLAKEIFPMKAVGGEFFHFAFLWRKNKLISIGQNNREVESAKALYFGERFDVMRMKKYSFLHAEISALSKAWGKTYIDSDFSLVSLRLNRSLELRNAKPCPSCRQVLDALNINDVFYSNSKGEIVY